LSNRFFSLRAFTPYPSALRPVEKTNFSLPSTQRKKKVDGRGKERNLFLFIEGNKEFSSLRSEKCFFLARKKNIITLLDLII
jgi:hypothetical protein